MIGVHATIDTASVIAAEHSEKVAIDLAWREHFDPKNPQSLRDEWARAFGRHVLSYISTTVSN